MPGHCPSVSRGTAGTHPYRGVPCPGTDNGSELYIKRPPACHARAGLDALRAWPCYGVASDARPVSSPKALRAWVS